VAGGTTGPTDPGDAQPDLLVSGGGLPVTVFAPGLGASFAETRPFGSGVSGTRAFLAFRGLTYGDLAGELRRVADSVAATRAVGVSLGAGAIIRLLATSPDRFERIVLVLPSGLDKPRSSAVVRRIVAAADLIEAGDAGALADALLDLQPVAVRSRDDVRTWARQRATELAGSSAGRQLHAFAAQVPLAARAVLGDCRARALVVAQEGDDIHPVDVAQTIAAALPDSELEIFPPGGLLWSHRPAVRARISEFLATA
jgi:3-oxoadipate enol-lactonase